jgi:hypothetical protein
MQASKQFALRNRNLSYSDIWNDLHWPFHSAGVDSRQDNEGIFINAVSPAIIRTKMLNQLL